MSHPNPMTDDSIQACECCGEDYDVTDYPQCADGWCASCADTEPQS